MLRDQSKQGGKPLVQPTVYIATPICQIMFALMVALGLKGSRVRICYAYSTDCNCASLNQKQ